MRNQVGYILNKFFGAPGDDGFIAKFYQHF